MPPIMPPEWAGFKWMFLDGKKQKNRLNRRFYWAFWTLLDFVG